MPKADEKGGEKNTTKEVDGALIIALVHYRPERRIDRDN